MLVMACAVMPIVFAQPAHAKLAGEDWLARGRAALDQKQYAEAEKDFAQAEAASPGKTSALALQAKALIHLNRFDVAQRCLETYLKQRPQSADARYLLGFVLFRRDLPRESLAAYTEAAKVQRPSADDFKIVGLDYVLLNDNADAIRWLERSVAEGPDDAEAHYCLGRAYYVQNSFEKAIASFERALQLDPGYAKAENNLGLAYEAKNRTDAAETAFRAAIEMENKSGRRTDQPYINLADLLSRDIRHAEALRLLDSAEQIGGKTNKIEELRGRVDLADEKLAQAEEHFRSAIAMKPQDGALHYLLARVLKREGRTVDADKEFAQTKALLGTQSSPDKSGQSSSGEHVELGRRYGAGRADEAIRELQEALRIEPADAEAVKLLRSIAKEAALNKMRAGDYQGALALLSQAREVLPQDAELLYESGFVTYAAGQRQAAQKLLEDALRIAPDYGDAAYELARVYLAGSLAEQAEAQMRRYLERKPEDATAQYGLGYILVAEQKRDEAKAAFKRSLELQPNQTESLYQLGLLAAEEGNGEDARADFARVLAKDPKHAGALTEVGVLAFRSARYDEAKDNLERAVAGAPSYQKAHYYYALTLSKLGKKEQADSEFEIAKSLQKRHGADGNIPATTQ